MIDATFVTALQGALKQKSELIDTGFGEKVLVVNGNTTESFADPNTAEPVTLELSTLQGVADYVGFGCSNELPVVIHVASPVEVRVVAPCYGDRRQSLVFARSRPNIPVISFGKYMPVEDFLIMVQSAFFMSDERVDLQKLCGSLKAAKQADFEDDGISQTVNVSTGVTRVATVAARLQWNLAPFRTFTEVTQPESGFVLRMKQVEREKDKVSIEAALFEADGGAWRVNAVTQIGEWLREHVAGDVAVLA